MKKPVAVLVLAAMVALASPQAARAGASEDAALALGAFAVFNQLITGQTIFHYLGGRRETVVVPPPVVYAPQPAVVYVPPPAVYAPPPTVVYAPPAVVYTPLPSVAYAHPSDGYLPGRRVGWQRQHGHPQHYRRHHDGDRW